MGTLAQGLSQYRQQQDNQFYTNLLSYGLQSAGEFDTSGDEITYTAGTDMMDKTAMWNQFISMKRGRVSPQDLSAFETSYNASRIARIDRQQGELDKLKLQGYSDRDIKDVIKDNPQLYNNMIDMISELKNSGDELSFNKAQTMALSLPEVDTGGLLGGLTGKYSPSTIALGGYGAYQAGKWGLDKFGKGLTTKLLGDPEAIKTFDEYKKGKYTRKDGKWLYGDKHSKAGQKVLPNTKAKLDRLYKASENRSWKKLFQRGGGMGMLPSLALYSGGTIGEVLGGEEGRRTGEVVGGAGLGVQAARRGAGLLGRLGAFGAKAAARHAAAASTGVGAHPFAQAGMLGLDAYLAYQMLTGNEE